MTELPVDLCGASYDIKNHAGEFAFLICEIIRDIEDRIERIEDFLTL